MMDNGVQSRTVYDVQNARYLTYKKGGKKGQKVALTHVEKFGKGHLMELKNDFFRRICLYLLEYFSF